MEYRNFQVILISAHNLLNVRNFLEMKVYAKIAISGNSKSEWTTPVDMDGKTNPRWNCKILYSIPEEAVQQEGRGDLVIKLYCKRSLKPDKYVGEVNLSLKKIFYDVSSAEIREYDVLRNGTLGTFGTLKLSYSFGTSTTHGNGQAGGASSTTGQGPGPQEQRRSGVTAFLLAASVLADGIQISEGISKGRNLHD